MRRPREGESSVPAPPARDGASRAAEPLGEWLDRVAEALALGPEGPVSAARWEQALLGPARSFLQRPGKALRASLTEHGWRLAGGEGEPPSELALVIELLHAGSLIVDDIEDDGERRRGEPTLHETHGTPAALNVGNWLYFAPLELLERLALPAADELALRRAVARTMTRGHHGQALDLGLRASELSRAEVPDVVATATRLKTGALMELAAQLGPLACGAPAAVCEALGAFGRRFGVALQMRNDLEGLVDGRAEDLCHGRATWPWAWLAQTADDVSFRRMQRRARAAMGSERDRALLASRLHAAIEASGRAAIAAELTEALAELAEALPRADLSPLEADVSRLRC